MSQKRDPNDPWITIPQAAKMLKIPKMWLFRFMHSDKAAKVEHFTTPGGHTRLKLDSLKKYLPKKGETFYP